MTEKLGREPRVKTTPEKRASWDWPTAPMAHSPRGFAELPFPWQEAKAEALRVYRAAKGTKPGKSQSTTDAVRPDAAKPADGPQPEAARGGERATLTTLADRLGLENGSAKHRYTDLYNMLFHPYRDQPIALLEVGHCGGTAGSDLAAADLPSIRLWLEYFTQGQIHGLDAADLSGFRHDRFAAHRCDPDVPATIAAAAAGMPDLDIIIDDASHASHHQQDAFLRLFPRLKSGGIYVIEDLRSQPAPQERAAFTKTATLFRGFSESRRFVHGDPATEAAFGALGGQISGCFLFQVGFDRRRRDQVAVIHKM
ncbi:MAG: hypothetical protein WAT09_16980 [Paracoccaceae bacterium]